VKTAIRLIYYMKIKIVITRKGYLIIVKVYLVCKK